MSRIQELARLIATHTDQIDQLLASEDLPTPSFDINKAELKLPSELQKSRDIVIEATTELKELLQGPKWTLLSNSVSLITESLLLYKLLADCPSNIPRGS